MYYMRMARVNVYLPDELAAQARAADLNVSALAQEALRAELDRCRTDEWLNTVIGLKPIDLPYEIVIEALDAGRDEFGRHSK